MSEAMVICSADATLVIGNSFHQVRSSLIEKLMETEPVNHGKWQQLDVSDSDAHATHELLNASVWYSIPETPEDAVQDIQPDLPWAEGHFIERVAGKAVNPGDWHDKWPYHQGSVLLHQNGGKYDHNYMERFWPTQIMADNPSGTFEGYRFPVGDYASVVAQLTADRGTRQAYLPIFFPEDTGATEGQRVPCTLGYHFIVRDGALHMQYNMRSCEAYRHFTNDVYMAARLAQHTRDLVDPTLRMGQLTLHAVSFHGFVGDTVHLEDLI